MSFGRANVTVRPRRRTARLSVLALFLFVDVPASAISCELGAARSERETYSQRVQRRGGVTPGYRVAKLV
ncbi:hypothetical protein EVAR_88466_1 [Eumeta japonica]|uniref:Uncharacterized protein n=1 Tax=Eumeta variegata TaxID=151549 RepID=A0A4C1XQZ3_EUMVA|nr:hypothetical protein EVAR_88466_1 [Eumeta japonica]